MQSQRLRKNIPVLPDIPWEYKNTLRYFSLNYRPAIIAEKNEYERRAWVKNKDEDNWRELPTALDVEYDNSGTPDGKELNYDQWLNMFSKSLEWTQVDEYITTDDVETLKSKNNIVANKPKSTFSNYISSVLIGILGGPLLFSVIFGYDDANPFPYIVSYSILGIVLFSFINKTNK